jgi:hypothetical protein
MTQSAAAPQMAPSNPEECRVRDMRTPTEAASTLYFVVFTDRCLSGWGEASGGRSLYALAVTDGCQEATLRANGEARSDMVRVRTSSRIPRLRAGDHLSIVGPKAAARWYDARGWAR